MQTATDKKLAEDFAVSRSTIWRWLKTGPTFPKPVCMGKGTVRWLQPEIDQWVQNRRRFE